MTPRLPTTTADAGAPTALGAFLRGVERRGLVLAQLLAGSGEAGHAALAWALERFQDEAARTAFGDWPRRFWSLLLAAPALRRPTPDPHWEPGFEWLSRIGHGPRAALLLRLVAGMAESDAASVLGVARPTYRLGLQRALPHHADGSADVEAWQALGRATQDMLRAIPQGAASTSTDVGEAGAAARDEDARRPAGPRTRVALGLVALATLAAFAATFLPRDRLPEGLEDAPGRILSEALPEAEPPVGRYDDGDALALHPDLELLLDAARPEPAATDPAFHAWLVAEGEADVQATPAAIAVAGIAPPGISTVAARAEEPRRPATARLMALDPPARASLMQRRDRWDALPYAERGELRERWLAWNELTPAERGLLREAVSRLVLRTPDEQSALRARFDALDGSVRHGWLLGPDLGADYPRLHPLIAQVPADARTALLEALRGLDAQARDDLAVLAARTPPQARGDLRVELLATPPAQRARWLRRKVAPVDGASP